MLGTGYPSQLGWLMMLRCTSTRLSDNVIRLFSSSTLIFTQIRMQGYNADVCQSAFWPSESFFTYIASYLSSVSEMWMKATSCSLLLLEDNKLNLLHWLLRSMSSHAGTIVIPLCLRSASYNHWLASQQETQCVKQCSTSPVRLSPQSHRAGHHESVALILPKVLRQSVLRSTGGELVSSISC